VITANTLGEKYQSLYGTLVRVMKIISSRDAEFSVRFLFLGIQEKSFGILL
jgi:hypothetical protein